MAFLAFLIPGVLLAAFGLTCLLALTTFFIGWRRKNRTLKYLSVVPLALLAALACLCFALVQDAAWQGSIDYRARPMAPTFLIATGSAMPLGICNLRIAGRSYPGVWKHWIWTSFDATDSDIKKIVGDEQPIAGVEAREIVEKSHHNSLNSRYDESDLAHVRWNEVDAVTKPQVYEIVGGTGGANSFWGHLIYDRARKRAYTYVNGGD